jgi:hypothetical protein
LRYILLIQTEETFSINTHRFYWFRGAQNFLSSCKTPLQPYTISIASLISSATAHLFFHYCCLFFLQLSPCWLSCVQAELQYVEKGHHIFVCITSLVWSCIAMYLLQLCEHFSGQQVPNTTVAWTC